MTDKEIEQQLFAYWENVTKEKLFVIYDKIRKTEFKRRELSRRIAEEREEAAALRSFDTGVAVLGGIRIAPQDKFIDRMSEYDEELTRTVKNAEKIANHFFYDVQKRVAWNDARIINDFITGTAPYRKEYGNAVERMANALNGTPADRWRENFPPFSFGHRSAARQEKPVTCAQRKAAAELALRRARGKPLHTIISTIRRLCECRQDCERGGRADELLYAQICALERRYVYSVQMCLTEKELLLIELYMTNAMPTREAHRHKALFKHIIAKLSAELERLTGRKKSF